VFPRKTQFLNLADEDAQNAPAPELAEFAANQQSSTRGDAPAQ